MSNLDRFKKDIELLIDRGVDLENAMLRDIYGEEYEAAIKKTYKEKDEAKKYLDKLPDFKKMYQAWYSEVLALVGQLLPNRVSDLINLYEIPKTRKALDHTTYAIHDYLLGTQSRNAYTKEVIVGYASALPKFNQQQAILAATEKRFESSLYEMKQLVQADLFDSELDTAIELNKNKFSRAAGAVAGVVLEKHLKEVCKSHGIKITKKNPTISDLNELLKADGTIELHQWRHITLLADIRNLCDHDKDNCVSGNGDGLVGKSGRAWMNIDPDINNENTQFWKHLSLTHVISGIDPSTDSARMAFGKSNPTAKINGGFVVVQSNNIEDGVDYSAIDWASYSSLVVRIQNQVGGWPENNPAINPGDAARIDRKLDDGIPFTGDVRSTSTPPVDTQNGCEGTYNEAVLNLACVVYFRVH